MLGPPRAPIRYWPWRRCVCGQCMGNVVCTLAKRGRPGWGTKPMPMRLLRPDVWDPSRGDPQVMIATRGRPRWGMPAHVPESFYSPINGITGQPLPYPSPYYSHAPELQKKRMDMALAGLGQYEPASEPEEKPKALSAETIKKKLKSKGFSPEDLEKLSEFISKNAGPVIIGMLIGSYIAKSGGKS